MQFGGQTPLKLAAALEEAGVPILGTSPDAIDLAEDRDRFKALIEKLGLQQPESGIARSPGEARAVADSLGYPVVIRPSYVLGGRAMEIVHDGAEIDRYVARLSATLDRPSELVVSDKRPLLIDRYLDRRHRGRRRLPRRRHGHLRRRHHGAHRGGRHPLGRQRLLAAAALAQRRDPRRARAADARACLALKVVGLMNVQFAIKDGDVYMLEVNPRASRTVPFVAKVIGKPIAASPPRSWPASASPPSASKPPKLDHVAVKEAVFPFARFPGVDPILGPEMRSTGEVMGIDRDFAMAFAKSQLGAGQVLPHARHRVRLGEGRRQGSRSSRRCASWTTWASRSSPRAAPSGTSRRTASRAKQVNKVLEGRPHIVDAMKNGDVALVFNTTEGAKALADSKDIRRTALLHHIPYYTTLAGAVAVTRAIKALKAGTLRVAPCRAL